MPTKNLHDNPIQNTNSEIKNVVNAIEKNSTSLLREPINDELDDGIVNISQGQQAILERYTGDTSLKKYLTFFVMAFTSVWSSAILVFLFLTGYGKIEVSDAVLITILTETLATVLGLPLVVTSHFFPKQK